MVGIKEHNTPIHGPASGTHIELHLIVAIRQILLFDKNNKKHKKLILLNGKKTKKHKKLIITKKNVNQNKNVTYCQ